MCPNPYAWAKFLHSVENELWPIVCVAMQGYAVAGEVGFGEIREFLATATATSTSKKQ